LQTGQIVVWIVTSLAGSLLHLLLYLISPSRSDNISSGVLQVRSSGSNPLSVVSIGLVEVIDTMVSSVWIMCWYSFELLASIISIRSFSVLQIGAVCGRCRLFIPGDLSRGCMISRVIPPPRYLMLPGRVSGPYRCQPSLTHTSGLTCSRRTHL